MEVSRLIFSNKTKEEMKRDLSPREKGRLRWEKLKECEKSGALSRAKNRNEVANLVGFASKNTGYSWVTNLIRRQHLKEYIYGPNKYEKIEYEYHLNNEPDFEYNHLKKKVIDDKIVQTERKPKTKNITLREKGKILYHKLKECDSNGSLLTCKTRADVARLVNGTTSWVRGMIERGYLKEQIVKYEDGFPVNSFALTGKVPNYDYANMKNVSKPKVSIRFDEFIKTTEIYKLEFTNKDITIKLDLENWNKVNEIIKNVLKGE